MAQIFITGGTGYIGRKLVPRLLGGGHQVRALVRPGSEGRLPAGCEVVVGNPLAAESFSSKVLPGATFIQLVGVPHPSPAKARQFREIDLVSVRESVAAARATGVAHFVYLSVAQPSPVMHAYVAVRAEGESMIRASGMNATFLRPLYVLGPGHRWPYLILPFFWIAELMPAKRAAARRLKPVTLEQTLQALMHAAQERPAGVRIVEAEAIRGTPGAS